MQIEIKYLQPRESTRRNHRAITIHSRKFTGGTIKMLDSNRGHEPLITLAQYNPREVVDLEQRCRTLQIELNLGQSSICFDIFWNKIKKKTITKCIIKSLKNLS